MQLIYMYGHVTKLPLNYVKWVEDIFEFNEDFTKSYNDETDEGNFLEVDVQYPGHSHLIHNNSPFLAERIKIEKIEKLAANLHHNTEYVIHIRNLKQALNHKLVLKKVHRMIEFNQKVWPKSYFDMSTYLRKAAKVILKKTFSS